MKVITDKQEAQEERAAIMQYDAGLSRIEAEKKVFGKPISRRDPFHHFGNNGFVFIPFLSSGKTLGSWPEKMKDYNQLCLWVKQGYKCFLAMNKNFVVLDLDLKGGKNGIKSLMEICPLWDIERHDFPAFTVSKSGGYHLYFKSEGIIYKGTCGVFEGIDIRCQTVPIMCPGSIKNKKEYLFFGDLKDSPLLPYVIRIMMKIHPSSPNFKRPTKQKIMSMRNISKNIELMADWLDKNCPESMNQRLYRLACWASKEGIGQNVAELVKHRYNLDPDHPDIAHAIRGAYGER